MRSLLLSAKCSRQDVLVQFWAPKTTPGGKKMLTVSQQPFGFGELCNGLCRYRCFCIDQQGFVGEDISQIGPPARVFQQGSPEFCPNIELYTPQEFPMGRYARSCGIVSYRALPLFQIRNHGGSQQQHNCVGVLEILSLGTLVNLELESLQDLGLSRPDSHSDECIRNRQSNLDLKNVWEFMMIEHNLPLIQVWVPCMCDSPGDNNNTSSSRNRILCQFTYSNWCNMKYSRMFDQLTCEAETCFVTNGKSWVGKACSLNKIFSFKDTNLFSISDYPLVRLIRSSDVRACLAIPLKLLHPQLPPFILEVFLPPPDQNWDGNLVALLTLLLSTVARGLIVKHNLVLEWTPVEGSCVKFAGADGDNYFYFDIIQDGDRALENGREGLQFQQSETFGAVGAKEHFQRIEYIDETFGRVFTNGEVGINWDADPQLPEATENLSRGNQISSIEAPQLALGIESEREKQQYSSSLEHWNAQNMCDTSGEIFSNGQVDEVAAENFGVDQPQFNEEASVLASDQPKANAEARSFGDDGTAEEAEITHDALKQQFGRNIVDVANHFGVCVSTVKRKCRKYGIDRWPPHKRNKGNCIKSNPMLPNNTEPANPLPSPKGKSITATEDEEIDGIYSMIVKATYRKDNAMFPLCSDSGIEELRKELYKRFELKDEKIKIRYKDETGDLIIISCNEDLEFRMRTLRKSGITVMRLSASLVTK